MIRKVLEQLKVSADDQRGRQWPEGLFKRATFSPAQPRRAKTRRFRGQGRKPRGGRGVRRQYVESSEQ